jgi:hypothetical protein
MPEGSEFGSAGDGARVAHLVGSRAAVPLMGAGR